MTYRQCAAAVSREVVWWAFVAVCLPVAVVEDVRVAWWLR